VSRLLAALRRLVVVVLALAGLTAVLSLLVGALLGASVDRSLTLGFYLVGCFLLVCGFFVGNRGPSRVKSETAAPGGMFGLGGRQLRWATLGEQNDAINTSAVFITLGVVLVVIGALLDSRHAVF
jgi:hypothetical protein